MMLESSDMLESLELLVPQSVWPVQLMNEQFPPAELSKHSHGSIVQEERTWYACNELSASSKSSPILGWAMQDTETQDKVNLFAVQTLRKVRTSQKLRFAASEFVKGLLVRPCRQKTTATKNK